MERWTGAIREWRRIRMAGGIFGMERWTGAIPGLHPMRTAGGISAMELWTGISAEMCIIMVIGIQ